MKRTIIHIDMDAFFASVEERDNPSLKGKPLIIGALPNERGVVSTCNYIARRYGIHSAMNIKEAYRRCPNGIFMHGDMSKYEEASRLIHSVMLKYTDIIEFVALDEGYMDVTGSLKLFGGAENIGRMLKKEIYDRVGVTCSVGISYSMMGAKLASEEKKPDGFFVIPDREALLNLIYDRPANVIFGVGAKTEKRLKELGIQTVRDVINTPPQVLEAFGKTGTDIIKLAMGEDDRQVIPDGISKSIGREHTFQKNTEDSELLKDVLLFIARDISLRAKRKELYGKTVTLKLKFGDMHTITRSKSGTATNSSKQIYKEASRLLDNLKLKDEVRLIGITLNNLCESKDEFSQLSLFDEIDGKEEIRQKSDALEDAIFELHERYGDNIVKTAKELGAEQRRKTKNKFDKTP